MKKSHPHSETQSQEPLYAQVNKPKRGNQRTQNQGEELIYATVSSVDPLSRGGRHAQRREDPETDYTEVAPKRPEQDLIYASVSSVDPLSRGGRHAQRREDPETDYTEVAPQQRGRSSSPSLTADQKSAMLLKNPQVQARAEEVMHWGTVVYGNDKIFQERLQDILKDPSKGKDLSDQLAENPEFMHKLAGRSTLGMKSQTRKAAEDGFGPLIKAIDDYTKAVHDATERLSRTPMAEQKRHQEHSRDAERGHHHHHERGQNSPEHSPRQQRHGEKGMAYAM
ncbi:BID domain-containing T4SS effector [Bartonella queenslandensis]|uniref:BID domain-containing T4SS effector n=1 Tax=Bartonella queenslandensis TaxID=481138 RepID=UPI001BA6667E|nr:BID domain-containing T4SS effector [Bartonella queenslandensis]